MKKVFLPTKIFVIVLTLTIQSFAQDLKIQDLITLETKIIKLTEIKWEFEVKIRNNHKEAIYLMTEPDQVNGNKGYYLQLNKKNNTILNVTSRIHLPLIISPYSNSTKVKLIKLASNEIFNDIVSIKFPVNETTPPTNSFPEELLPKLQSKTFIEKDFKAIKENDLFGFGKKINPEKVHSVEFSYGYFVEEPGIVNFLKCKPFGWYFNGNETMFSGDSKGKTLLEIQKIITSGSIPIKY